MQLTLEAFVVFLMSTLTAGAVMSAFTYLLEREWPAVVFLSLAAFSTVWYGVILLTVVRAAF
jgi:hypothetical protein